MQVSPGPTRRVPACPVTGSASASQLKTWKQALKTAKTAVLVSECMLRTLTLLLEYSVGLLSLMVVVLQLISSLLLFPHPSLSSTSYILIVTLHT